MGLLDDAIREHLELKRRHGADPSDVARQEHEALGPPRRGVAAPLPVDEDFADEDERFVVDETSPRPPVRREGEDDDYDSDAGDDAPVRSQPVGEPEAPVAPPAPPQGADEPSGAVAMDEYEEPPARARRPVEPDDDLGEPSAYERPADRDRATPPPDPSRGDDVLEETPEFLQETPEHDRLWFEQKPPKDFDF
jgi:hypothetical protein